MPGTDYDLSFDEDYEDEEGEPGQSRPVDHLPPPPEMGGMSGYSDIHGEHAAMIGGRSTSPRLFVQAAGHPTVSQLRVWKIENGVPVGLGAIDATSSEDDMVQHFFAAMPHPGEGKAIFKVRPIDVDGREMGTEATVIIGEHHAALQRMRRVEAATNGGGGGAPVIMPQSTLPSEVMGMMQQSMDASRGALDSERERSRELLHQMAQERIDLASNATASIQAMSERMLDAETSRNDTAMRSAHHLHQQTSDNTAAFFQSQLEMMRAERERDGDRSEREKEVDRERYARELGEADERRRRERGEADTRRERERDEVDRKRTTDREDWERRMIEMRREDERREKEREQGIQRERDAAERRWKMEQSERRVERERSRDEEGRREMDRQREHDMKVRQMELESGQQREHAERMMQLQQTQLAATMAQARGGDIKKTIKEAMSTMAMLGIEPGDMIQRMFTPQGSGEGGAAWADLAGKMLGTVGEVAKAKMVADVEKRRPTLRMAAPPPQIGQQRMVAPVGNPNMMGPGMPPGAMYPGMPPGQMPPGAMPPPGPMPPGQAGGPHYGAVGPMDDLDDEDWDDFDLDEDEGPDEGLDMEGLPTGAPQAPPPPQSPPKSALGLPIQRAARASLRGLVSTLKNTPVEDWGPSITIAYTSEPAIYHYISEVSVDKAIEEAGGHGEFKDALVDALKASPLIPADLNYGGEG